MATGYQPRRNETMGYLNSGGCIRRSGQSDSLAGGSAYDKLDEIPACRDFAHILEHHGPFAPWPTTQRRTSLRCCHTTRTTHAPNSSCELFGHGSLEFGCSGAANRESGLWDDPKPG